MKIASIIARVLLGLIFTVFGSNIFLLFVHRRAFAGLVKA
jgi:hypothetical protein